MTSSTETKVVETKEARSANERAACTVTPLVQRRLVGTDMSPGAWLIRRIDFHLARLNDPALVRHGYSFPSRYDRFARVRFTCESRVQTPALGLPQLS